MSSSAGAALSPASPDYRDLLTFKRPDWSWVNRMSGDTRDYVMEWQKALAELALKRALNGKFTREFPFPTGATKEDWTNAEEAVIRTIALEIAPRVSRTESHPLIVLVGGGGAAGKSTFCSRLKTRLASELKRSSTGDQDSIQELELDRYFYPVEVIADRQADGKYDNPLNSDLLRARKNIEALRKREDVAIPVHDKFEHLLAKQTCEHVSELRNARVIIVQGLYTLGPGLRELGDFAIYIDASQMDRAKGRVWRDINVRERPEDHVVEMLMGREAYHQMFVEPTQTVADYIVRRKHTPGSLEVNDNGEKRDVFIKACGGKGLDQGAAQNLWKAFEDEWRSCLETQKRDTPY